MTIATEKCSLPNPPDRLRFGDVWLHFYHVVPGDAARDLVPYYHFRIRLADDAAAGHINFRVGDTEHVRLFAGHIGFEVDEAIRGRGLARQACLAIAPFVRSFYDVVTITCDPNNHASIRTIEKLGASFIEEVSVPPPVSHHQGIRIKRRYRWEP
jgi:tagatose 1,6-diphosphate aldolase